MKAEEIANGIHASADDPRSRAELLKTIQRQERELAVLASMVAAKDDATVVAETVMIEMPAPETEMPETEVPEVVVLEMPVSEPHIHEAPSTEPQIASYLSLSRQLVSLGRKDTKRVLQRLRLLK